MNKQKKTKEEIIKEKEEAERIRDVQDFIAVYNALNLNKKKAQDDLKRFFLEVSLSGFDKLAFQLCVKLSEMNYKQAKEFFRSFDRLKEGFNIKE